MNELGSEDLLEKVDKLLGHYVDAVQETFGIYKMLNKNDIVLYVGKAKNLKSDFGVTRITRIFPRASATCLHRSQVFPLFTQIKRRMLFCLRPD